MKDVKIPSVLQDEVTSNAGTITNAEMVVYEKELQQSAGDEAIRERNLADTTAPHDDSSFPAEELDNLSDDGEGARVPHSADNETLNEVYSLPSSVDNNSEFGISPRVVVDEDRIDDEMIERDGAISCVGRPSTPDREEIVGIIAFPSPDGDDWNAFNLAHEQVYAKNSLKHHTLADLISSVEKELESSAEKASLEISPEVLVAVEDVMAGIAQNKEFVSIMNICSPISEIEFGNDVEPDDDVAVLNHTTEAPVSVTDENLEQNKPSSNKILNTVNSVTGSYLPLPLPLENASG